MVCQCIENGHWPLPRRYILNSVEEIGRYHLAESTGGGSREASPAPPSSPDISMQKKNFSSSEAATLAALQAAGYTSIDQVLAFQAAVAAGSSTVGNGSCHQPDLGTGTSSPSSSSVVMTSRGGRGSGRGSRGGRGRGRGSRGSSVGVYSREDFASAASLAKNSGSPLPSRGRGSRGGHILSRSSSGSTRGRKRKFENTDASSTSKASLPPPDSSAWEVNVPLISLVNGNLIHGDKAPKRRHLEAWLEAHPDYMPYSVEPEDRAIFNRVAKARGQDTSAMEALAYRHYMTSVLSKVATYAASSSQRPTPSTSITSANELMEQQQKQLLAFVAASAYSGNPAYASLFASALGYSQVAAAATATTSTSSASSNHQKAADSTDKPSTSAGTNSCEQSGLGEDQSGQVLGTMESSSLVPPSSTSTSTAQQFTPENLQSVLTAYQQAASIVAAAYMYNPALYGQHFGGGSGSSNSSNPTPTNSASTPSTSDVLQRQQQMSNLLSSVFGSASVTSQQSQKQTDPSSKSTTGTTETSFSITQPILQASSSSRVDAGEDQHQSSKVIDKVGCVPTEPGAGSVIEPVVQAGGASNVCGDGDVLDLSKPE